MARLRSISLRLTVWFSSVFLIGLILFGVAMRMDLAYSLHAGRQRTLMRRAARLAELLESSKHLTPAERAYKFKEFEEGTPEGSLIQVFDADHNLVYPAETDQAVIFPWPADPVTGELRWSKTFIKGQPYLILTRPIEMDARRLNIFVAGQLSDNESLLFRFQVGLLSTIPLLFLLSAVGGYLLSRRALKPVDRLTVSARAFSVNNLSGRLPVAHSGDELQRLAETCNDMLARLEAAVLQMKRFTADASHELRSPLSFIRTVAECARLKPDMDAESRQAFDDIIQETGQAGHLLEDMLALARADSGEGNWKMTRVDLAGVLQDSCSRIRLLAGARRQTVRLDAQDSAWVTADPDSLARLVWILLDNAVKYTPEEGSIDVQVRRTGREVKVSVSDTGIGIPSSALPHIFDRFYRVDPSRSEVSGTGLGLAIARWIAEKHHAALTVSSQQDVGSTFQLVFPAA